MDPCCTPELERGFDERVAARDLATYRRQGLPPDQRRLLAGLVTEGLGGQTVLDIGGGIGAIHHDLLRAGARSVMDVDGSTAYLDAAQAEARRLGDVARIDYRHGDFVQLADGIEPADVVLLLRVLCCYPDMPALVQASARRARRSYGVIYPRSTWWMRAAAAAYDAVRPVEGSVSGPGYVHKESEVDLVVLKEGFTPVLSETTVFWRVALYRRTAAA